MWVLASVVVVVIVIVGVGILLLLIVVLIVVIVVIGIGLICWRSRGGGRWSKDYQMNKNTYHKLEYKNVIGSSLFILITFDHYLGVVAATLTGWGLAACC